MNHVDIHNSINMRWGAIPAINTVASYNFFDQAVAINFAKSEDIRNIGGMQTKEAIYTYILDVWLSSFHEYQHWIDMTSTAYGLRWISNLCDANESTVKIDATIDPFVKASLKNVAKMAMSIKLPRYYSTIEGMDSERPWIYESTVGKAFGTDNNICETYPIWFVRFSNKNTDRIARQPLTIASLLEVRAIVAEFDAFFINMATQIPSEEYKRKTREKFNKEILERVYAPELTLYSVAAHWYANQRNLSDVLDAYQSAGRLAHFCLDVPTAWLQSIKSTPRFRKRMGQHAGDLMDLSFRRCDRTALFFMLAMDDRLKTYKTFELDLKTLVAEEWGVELEFLIKETATECSGYISNLSRQVNNDLKKFLDALSKNLTLKTDQPFSVARFHELHLPAILLADNYAFNIYTFRTGTDAFTGKIFDPKPHMQRFFSIEKLLSLHGKYSDFGQHCFADPL